MAITVSINGSSYSIPTQGETKWGTAVTALLQALSTGLLQKAGGSFPLTAEVDFGSNFGTAQIYIKSKSDDIGSAGFMRLAKGDVIAWRNHDGSGNAVLEYYRNTVFNYDIPKYSGKELVNLDSMQFLQNKVFGDISATPIDPTLIFEVRSTDKGSLPYPPMTTTERDAISGTKKPGLSIYNVTKDLVEYWNGTEWIGGNISQYIRKDIPQEITGNPRMALASTITPSSAGNETLDCAAASLFMKTGGTATINLSGMTEGQVIHLYVSATGSSYTITWAGGTYKWLYGEVPTPSATSGEYDLYIFEKVGGIIWSTLAGVYS